MKDLVVDQEIEVLIEKLDHNGNGLVRLDHFPIFVKKALPGEKCLIKISKKKKNFAEAEIVKILSESPHRIEPSCTYYDLCQGCNTMHYDYELEKEFKSQKVKEIITRGLKDETLEVSELITDNNIENYRNKITIVTKDRKMGYLNGEGKVIDIHRCNLAGKAINEVLAQLKIFFLYYRSEKIIIREGVRTGQLMIIFTGEKDINNKKVIGVLTKIKAVKSIIHFHNGEYLTIYGQNHILEKLNDTLYCVSPESFFQINTGVAELLYGEIKNIVVESKAKNILDLYCGAGSISCYLAPVADKVLGVEINKKAIEDAKENAHLNHLKNVTFIKGDAIILTEETINEHINPDLVILDPPRRGLDSKLIVNLIELNPETIIYVSCDPMTLVRDLIQFKEKYSINKIIPVDMFPRTKHVETIVKLSKI